MLVAEMLHIRQRQAQIFGNIMELNGQKAKQGKTIPMPYIGTVVISHQ